MSSIWAGKRDLHYNEFRYFDAALGGVSDTGSDWAQRSVGICTKMRRIQFHGLILGGEVASLMVMEKVHFIYQDSNRIERRSDGLAFVIAPKMAGEGVCVYCNEYDSFALSISDFERKNSFLFRSQ